MWPWQVTMHYNGRHICGATVIHEEWVLTAAHCIPSTDLERWLLFFGKLNQSETSPNEVNRTVTQIIVHPDYNNITIDNDLTLMKLSSPLNYTEFIRPICLASNASQFNDGISCWISGWGRLGAEEPNVGFERLQEVEVPIVGNNQCRCNYALFDIAVNSNMLCAGEEGKGACQGDSGGPVQCKQGSRWIQAGLGSFGIPCANEGFPEVFARVSFFQDWITAQVEGANISFVTYTSRGVDHDANFVCLSSSTTLLSSLSLLLLVLTIQAL
ncbi:chymotrypsin-like protease CTRL-1 [Corythoichthys intestinalis]|uniref:chymotrypsin-like protease CTRL-1 n=1 Tax=Corythoichthys intestinalis TaxID=161448 RepID=UPI0025A67D93|nr:chymotrypsin-like protease CTRL-1 [Corythoichthys intestinalis]